MGNQTCVLSACRAMPQLNEPSNTGGKTLIFYKNVFNQRCQPSDVLQCNTNRYDSYGKAMFNTAGCMLVPTAYS
jgi:hypothetical protein